MKLTPHSISISVPGMPRIDRLLAAFACGITLTLSSGHASAQELSAAEKLLFQTNHLDNISNPQKLRYSYVQKGTVGPGFSDDVVIDVGKKNPDGTAAVSARFLSGEREVPLTELKDVQGNPALLGFLERDIREMKRLTGGQPNYFRKRIRLALVDASDIETVSLTYKGENVSGKKIAIQPYLNDPMQHKFQQYVDKRYVFIFSEKIPGSLYQVQTTIPDKQQAGDGKAGAQLIEETMTVAS